MTEKCINAYNLSLFTVLTNLHKSLDYLLNSPCPYPYVYVMWVNLKFIVLIKLSLEIKKKKRRDSKDDLGKSRNMGPSQKKAENLNYICFALSA